ncbi:hypothetical protein [Streptomyces sp. NPDC001422]|uniref:hypothetical protein n=1 Tax=Streptomyces sp. NPDC001422 TaxID=3364575 RepID=UPI0036A012B7
MNFPFVTRRHHDTEITQLRERVLATEARHDEVEKERRELADELNRQKPALPMRRVADAARAASDGEARPIDGASAGPLPLTTQLRRAKDHASALDRQLATVTAANQACTCGGAA